MQVGNGVPDHECRMLKRKRHLRERQVRKGALAAKSVGRFVPEPDIGNQIEIGKNTESVVDPAREGPSICPGCVLLVKSRVEDPAPVGRGPA